MAFPSSPVDGQLAIVNGITYRYSSSSVSWTRSITTTGFLADYVQVWNSTQINGMGIDVDIIFDTLGSSSGIPYNPSTGVFDLTAGRTYELNASPTWSNFTNVASGYLSYTWVDAVTNVQIQGASLGTLVGIAVPLNTSTNQDPNSALTMIYTPQTDRSIKLRIIDAVGTARLNGGSGCVASIKQLNSNSMAGNITIGGGANSVSSSTGSVVINGGLGVYGNIHTGSVGSPSTLNVTGSAVVSNNITVSGTINAGSGAFTKTPSSGDVRFDNGSTDTPGVAFYYASNTNFGIDSYYNPGPGTQQLRIRKNLNETGASTIATFDTNNNFNIVNGTIQVNGNIAVNGPACLIKANTTTNMTSNVWTKIVYDNEIFDTNSNFTNSKFTPTVPGYYTINFTVGCATFPVNNGTLMAAIYKNGSEYLRCGKIPATLGGGIVSGSSLVEFNGTTDYVEIYGIQTTGYTVSTENSPVSGIHFSASMTRGK
jgi:hypothetical protein